MAIPLRFTVADLDAFPDDGKRREVIDGELYVSSQPSYQHQNICGSFYFLLRSWSNRTNAGQAILAPGVIFAVDDAVAPDVIWLSWRRLAEADIPGDGHLHAPPELVIEVLSPGSANERRDREVKLKLYSRRGVAEYWLADWRTETVEVYRRAGEALELVARLTNDDPLTSPLLPGFEHPVSYVFRG